MPNDFTSQVRDFIQRHVPKGELADFEELTAQADGLEQTLQDVLEKPSKQNLGSLWQIAYDYSDSQMDLYQTEIRLVASIAAAVETTIEGHRAELAKIPKIETRSPSTKENPGQNLWNSPDERATLFVEVQQRNREREKIIDGKIKPSKVQRNKALTFGKALSGRASYQFASKPKKLSSTTNLIAGGDAKVFDPLGADRHVACSNYADMKLEFLTEAVGDDDGKAYLAVAEAKREHSAKLEKRERIVAEESNIWRKRRIAERKAAKDALREQAVAAVKDAG